MTLKEQPIESHEIHSRRLLAHAEEWLDKGDRLQASEKAWGAVAHYFKVIADRRGWEYETHADAFEVARSFAVEQDNPTIRTLFDVAHGIGINYYKDAKTLDYIRKQLDDVKALLDILQRAEPPAAPEGGGADALKSD